MFNLLMFGKFSFVDYQPISDGPNIDLCFTNEDE